MGVDDFSFWEREAVFASLDRKAERYSASMIPHIKQEARKRIFDEIHYARESLDKAEQIEKDEKEAEEKRKAFKARMDKKRRA